MLWSVACWVAQLATIVLKFGCFASNESQQTFFVIHPVNLNVICEPRVYEASGIEHALRHEWENTVSLSALAALGMRQSLRSGNWWLGRSRDRIEIRTSFDIGDIADARHFVWFSASTFG